MHKSFCPRFNAEALHVVIHLRMLRGGEPKQLAASSWLLVANRDIPVGLSSATILIQPSGQRTEQAVRVLRVLRFLLEFK
jgi:hypothetical protein